MLKRQLGDKKRPIVSMSQYEALNGQETLAGPVGGTRRDI